MEIEELLNYRIELLEESKDEDGFVLQSNLLSQVLPLMLESKLVDSEDYNEAYYIYEKEKLKINGYAVNESGERLQLFIVDENSIHEGINSEKLLISIRNDYENQFKRVQRFISKGFKRQLNDNIQDSSPAKVLLEKISSKEGFEQFDVIEIFLVSLTVTVSFKGNKPEPRSMFFDDEKLKLSYRDNTCQLSKEILVITKLIDLNYLYRVIASQGNREPLTIIFPKTFGYCLEAIKAADENNFESYLCVLPAQILYDLYRQYSSRLLEKNIRSFLQFKGINREIKRTIKDEPEKFIAYNNGLTITAVKAKISEKKRITLIESLTDFQIVNGGQTTATIYFAKKEGLDISKVKVMAKINIAKYSSDQELDQLISNISRYSNAQSRVSAVDLRSRNPQLLKLKNLSENVITPTGHKWFFERAKGEFNTKVRIKGGNGNWIKKEYPPERRFSKEQLAKYYTAWGNKPYLVKKGGEKVFRLFIEEISPEDNDNNSVVIDRNFYEQTISKIILFRNMEKIYGQGANSMGQIRSATVPYAISVIYSFTDGKRNGIFFDLSKIWMKEGIDEELSIYLVDLLKLVNDLIKKYSLSEDYGEYSKRKELWDMIIKSPEIKEFMETKNSKKIFEKYCINE